MKFWLISDNHDTLVGMRLSGIEGVLVEDKELTAEALKKAIEDDSVGIILITEKLSKLCPELIDDLKLHRSKPLIVEIPDRHAGDRSEGSLVRYISEAIGLKL